MMILKNMRVSYIGNTPAFQAGKVGSIPTTRSIKKDNLIDCLFFIILNKVKMYYFKVVYLFLYVLGESPVNFLNI